MECVAEYWLNTVSLPREYGYKGFYPILNASESEKKDANLFRCVQMMPMFFMLMMMGGIKHPSICGSLGLLYVVTRYLYFTGYATGDPQNRLGIWKYGFVTLLGLMITSISCGVKLLST